MAFHIPTEDFFRAERAKGYLQNETEMYTLVVDVTAKDAVFAGHFHRTNTWKESGKDEKQDKIML